MCPPTGRQNTSSSHIALFYFEVPNMARFKGLCTKPYYSSLLSRSRWITPRANEGVSIETTQNVGVVRAV